MSRSGKVKSENGIGFIILTVLIIVIGFVEMAQPSGLELANLTAGMVTMDTMVRIGILTIVVVGLNLVMGYAGQISLGQAGFYGIGAYVSAILTTLSFRHNLLGGISDNWWFAWLAMIVGMLLTGLFAYVVGGPILRLRGNYLAMATLGLGIVTYTLFREGADLTGGNDGLGGIPRLAIGSFSLWPMERYYFVVWAFTLLVIFLALNLVNSRIGRALRAIQSSEMAANTLGVDTDRYKLQVFIVSAMLASLAGSLYAHFQSIVAPGTFDFVSSVELVVIAAVGGLSSIWGAPFGVAVILILQQFIRNGMQTMLHLNGGGQEFVFFGIILILIMILMPQGLTTGAVRAYRRWLAART